ncbi:hypothetical protein ACFE04_022668 [Oxalis oulophora]
MPQFSQEVRAVENYTSFCPANDVYSNTEGRSSPRIYVNKAQDVVSNMLAKGSALGQDAVSKGKAFDEKHKVTVNASAKVISFDRRVGLSEKLNVGISVVNEKVKSVDQRVQISDQNASPRRKLLKKEKSCDKSNLHLLDDYEDEITFANTSFSTKRKVTMIEDDSDSDITNNRNVVSSK